jgi:hypothetical protein
MFPTPFVSDFRDANIKKVIFSHLFCLFLLLVHRHQSSKIKSHKELTKQQKAWFLLIFCFLMEGFASVQNNYGSGSRSPKKHTDPEH